MTNYCALAASLVLFLGVLFFPWPAPRKSLLHEAARAGQAEVVTARLKEALAATNAGKFIGMTAAPPGAQFANCAPRAADIRDFIGMTPLHHASASGHLEIARLLLEGGADLQAQDAFGMTPLHWAAFHGAPELIQYLLAQGAKAESSDSLGMTPLHWAAHHGQSDAVRALLAAPEGLRAQDRLGRTSLHWATRDNHRKVMEQLLASDAASSFINLADINGMTPLDIAASVGRKDLVELLLAHGAR